MVCEGVIRREGVGTQVTKAQTEIKIRDSMNQREMAPFVQRLSRHGSLSAALAPKPVRLKIFFFYFPVCFNGKCFAAWPTKNNLRVCHSNAHHSCQAA